LNLDFRVRIRRLLCWLLALFAAHTAAMVLFEGLGLSDAVWLTFTTLTTVGYGDLSAATPAGRAATMLLLYVAGITLLAQLASEYIDYRIDHRHRKVEGRWMWNMRDHLVIINSPIHDGSRYCQHLFEQLRETPEFSELPVQMLTTEFPEGLPQRLRDLGVVHYHGAADTDAGLDAVSIHKARCILVLAGDHYRRSTDALTFDIVHRIYERIDPNKVHLVVECVDDDNRRRLKKLGVPSVIRPIRTYPELAVRALAEPGVEAVLENLFCYDDDHPMRFELTITGVRWADVVTSLIQNDLGTAMAYIEHNGAVNCNPPANRMIDAKALIVTVRAGAEPGVPEIKAALGL
jgi:voltage-gated potassium channel